MCLHWCTDLIEYLTCNQLPYGILLTCNSKVPLRLIFPILIISDWNFIVPITTKPSGLHNITRYRVTESGNA